MVPHLLEEGNKCPETKPEQTGEWAGKQVKRHSQEASVTEHINGQLESLCGKVTVEQSKHLPERLSFTAAFLGLRQIKARSCRPCRPALLLSSFTPLHRSHPPGRFSSRVLAHLADIPLSHKGPRPARCPELKGLFIIRSGVALGTQIRGLLGLLRTPCNPGLLTRGTNPSALIPTCGFTGIY